MQLNKFPSKAIFVFNRLRWIVKRTVFLCRDYILGKLVKQANESIIHHLLIYSRDKNKSENICRLLDDAETFVISTCNEAVVALQKSYDVAFRNFIVIEPSLRLAKTIIFQFKALNPDTPIVVVEEELHLEKILELYKSGADNIITALPDDKPLAWILDRTHCMLDKEVKMDIDIIEFGSLMLLPRGILIDNTGAQIARLPPREEKLLRYLLEHKNKAIALKRILENVFGTGDDFFAARTYEVYITRLRKFIRHDPSVQIIRKTHKTDSMKNTDMLLIENNPPSLDKPGDTESEHESMQP